MNIKLTTPQQIYLAYTYIKCGCDSYCKGYPKPFKKLVELGLVRYSETKKPNDLKRFQLQRHWSLTDAGRQYYKANEEKFLRSDWWEDVVLG